ncbi:MAG: hypothetical protein ACM3QW_03635 [Ignavibacteriales bacterium]
MKKKVALILAAVMLLVLTAGCGGAGKTVTTKDGSVTFNKEGTVTFEGKDGSKSEVEVAKEEGGEVALPEGYPTDLVPIMSGAKIVLANRNQESGKTTYWVTASTTESAQDTYKYYQEALKDLQDPSNMQMNNIYSLGGVKDGQQINLIITPEDDNKSTNLQITIAPKE